MNRGLRTMQRARRRVVDDVTRAGDEDDGK
jgi:hypothetical protein